MISMLPPLLVVLPPIVASESTTCVAEPPATSEAPLPSCIDLYIAHGTVDMSPGHTLH